MITEVNPVISMNEQRRIRFLLGLIGAGRPEYWPARLDMDTTGRIRAPA